MADGQEQLSNVLGRLTRVLERLERRLPVGGGPAAAGVAGDAGSRAATEAGKAQAQPGTSQSAASFGGRMKDFAGFAMANMAFEQAGQLGMAGARRLFKSPFQSNAEANMQMGESAVAAGGAMIGGAIGAIGGPIGMGIGAMIGGGAAQQAASSANEPMKRFLENTKSGFSSMEELAALGVDISDEEMIERQRSMGIMETRRQRFQRRVSSVQDRFVAAGEYETPVDVDTAGAIGADYSSGNTVRESLTRTASDLSLSNAEFEARLMTMYRQLLQSLVSETEQAVRSRG